MAADDVIDGGMLVWILDDDEAMCALLSRQCRKLGWKIQSFHHPKDFFSAYQQQRPHLLVLDQLLPGKQGLDVLRVIRQDVNSLPVVMLSALGSPNDRIAGLEGGADDYLAKPFQFRELQLRIERLLRPQSLPSVLAEAVSPPPSTLHSETFVLGPLRFEAGRQHRLLTPHGEWHRLSRGDGALLLAFCRCPGLVLRRDHLLRATGSLVTPGESRTIDVRLSRLRRLLRQLTGVELVIPERGQGYRLVADVKQLGNDTPTHSQS